MSIAQNIFGRQSEECGWDSELAGFSWKGLKSDRVSAESGVTSAGVIASSSNFRRQDLPPKVGQFLIIPPSDVQSMVSEQFFQIFSERRKSILLREILRVRKTKF